jgi:hypothetical protein
MLSAGLIIIVALAWLALLFGAALYGERRSFARFANAFRQGHLHSCDRVEHRRFARRLRGDAGQGVTHVHSELRPRRNQIYRASSWR